MVPYFLFYKLHFIFFEEMTLNSTLQVAVWKIGQEQAKKPVQNLHHK